jgi:hypothetical protein
MKMGNLNTETILSLAGILVAFVAWLIRLEARTDKALEKAIKNEDQIESIKNDLFEKLGEIQIDIAKIKGKLGIEI